MSNFLDSVQNCHFHRNKVFDIVSNATVTEKAGGMTVTAGPVTQQP